MGARSKKEVTEINNIPKFKFSEGYIQQKLNFFFAVNTPKYIIENLYVFDWESDKLIITKSGLSYEFEIKISRGDFKNDFKKIDKHTILEGKEEYIPSYDKILDAWKPRYTEHYKVANRKKPNYFYYAVPEGMITPDEVPEYAGLVYVIPKPENGEWLTKDGEWCGNGLYVVKEAPKLHTIKYTGDDLNLSDKFYYNMLTWKDKYILENERRLLTEDKDHKIPYAELLEKYEKLQENYDEMKVILNCKEQTNKYFAETMEMDRHIIRGYQSKMKEIDNEFDCLDFEDKILEEYS